MSQPNSLFQRQYPNGLVLVAQSMPWLQTAAFSLSVPAGCRYDPLGQLGLANFTCEMVFRGGGELGNRELVETLESLGCDYYSSAGLYHSYFGGALPAENLSAALNTYAQVLREPHFPADQLEDGRNVCLQEILGLEDDLAGRAMKELRLSHYGHPWGRHADGELEDLNGLQLPALQSFYRAHYQPEGSVLAVAGNVDWEELQRTVDHLWGDWSPQSTMAVVEEPGCHGYRHLPFESNQTHITMAWPGLHFSDPNYFRLRAAIGMLSDGMSSRLFREVRERRGLCYTVSANCHSLLDRGAVFAYSGTTTASAQETLDVMLEQINLLSQGVSEAELSRLKVQLRSSLIMQQESCRSRANSLAGDYFHLGRLRSLDEMNQRIEALTVSEVNEFLAENPAGPFDIVTLGEQPLEVPSGISTTSIS